MEAGFAKMGSSGLMRLRKGSHSMAALCSSACPKPSASFHSLRQRSYIHMPHIFLRKRVVPSMPPSLVKLRSKLRALMMASCVSMPIRLHVPLLRYANFSFAAGTAATALPVSWPATAITGTAPRPVIFCTSSVIVPMTVAGLTISPNWPRFSPTLSTSLLSRSFVLGSSICDVEAIVYSHTALPVSI